MADPQKPDHAGSWLSDAKRYFSKTGCAAYQIGQDYLDGIPIRQDYLEKAIDWISNARGDSNMIEKYMGKQPRESIVYGPLSIVRRHDIQPESR